MSSLSIFHNGSLSNFLLKDNNLKQDPVITNYGILLNCKSIHNLVIYDEGIVFFNFYSKYVIFKRIFNSSTIVKPYVVQ